MTCKGVCVKCQLQSVFVWCVCEYVCGIKRRERERERECERVSERKREREREREEREREREGEGATQNEMKATCFLWLLM